MGSISVWQNFEFSLENYICFGQIFIVANGQILAKLSSHLVTLPRLFFYQCDHIWQNFATLANILRLWQHFDGSFSIWQKFVLILAKFYAIGQIFIIVNGQIINSNLAIWSLCRLSRLLSRHLYRYLNKKPKNKQFKLYFSDQFSRVR